MTEGSLVSHDILYLVCRIFREIEESGEVERGPIFGDALGIPSSIIERGSHHVENMAA